jgi:hypothetical protein
MMMSHDDCICVTINELMAIEPGKLRKKDIFRTLEPYYFHMLQTIT